MNKIRILIIGKEEWINSFEENVLSFLNTPYILEKIVDINYAIGRLEHDSYDVLILEDSFCKYNSIYLTTLAYAMTRPSLVICENVLSLIKYKLWKIFSPFSMKFKISRKLIRFNLNNITVLDKIEYLSKNHLQYFDKINEEFSKYIAL